jgi:hypothetical protein
LSSFKGRIQGKPFQYPTGGQGGGFDVPKVVLFLLSELAVMIRVKMKFNTGIYHVKLKKSVTPMMEVPIVLIWCWN